jgi:hypothetical protein
MVGSAAMAELRRLGIGALRLGARRADRIRQVRAGEWDGQGEVVAVDATDPADLAAFCAGCQVVLNCAGPSYLLTDTVAAATVRAGGHYVDVAGDDPACEGMAARGLSGTDRSVVFSAGTLPGLSSIVPRWLARRSTPDGCPARTAAPVDIGRPRALTAHVGGMEPCSPAVTTDMMLSLRTGGADGAAFGEPLAAWRGGQLRSRALRAAEDTVAPFFPGPVACMPFLSTETGRLARALRLDDVDWYTVYPGGAVWAELRQLPGYAHGPDSGHTDAGVRLMRAARLDLAGRSPYYLMVFTMWGERDGAAVTRTAVLRTPSSYRLTGLVGAITTRAVLDGRTPPGLHYACDVLDPDHVVGEVRRSGVLTTFSLLDAEPGIDVGVL